MTEMGELSQYWPITGTCPHCDKPGFVITCSVCGHRGCYRRCERHDCYWVFRERFAKAESKSKQAQANSED
jgi:hypothetical protein